MDKFIAHNETLEETIKVIEKEKNKGKSLEQLQEANILEEWADYGWDFISVDRWIETIYDSME